MFNVIDLEGGVRSPVGLVGVKGAKECPGVKFPFLYIHAL